MIERRFPVLDPSIDIDRLAQIVGKTIGVELRANGTIKGIRIPVYALVPTDGEPVKAFVRNYAADPTVGRREVGIAVRGDKHEELFAENISMVAEYFI